MSTTADGAPEAEFELSIDEQWAVHAVLLASVERAFEDSDDARPAVGLTLLRKVEEGNHSFTAFEFDRLRHECERAAAAADTPDRDRSRLRGVADRIVRQCSTVPSNRS
jgi:hypothetical protein